MTTMTEKTARRRRRGRERGRRGNGLIQMNAGSVMKRFTDMEMHMKTLGGDLEEVESAMHARMMFAMEVEEEEEEEAQRRMHESRGTEEAGTSSTRSRVLSAMKDPNRKIRRQLRGQMQKAVDEVVHLAAEDPDELIRQALQGFSLIPDDELTVEERLGIIPQHARRAWLAAVEAAEAEKNPEVLETLTPHVIRILGPLEGGMEEAVEIASYVQTISAYRELVVLAYYHEDGDACVYALESLGNKCTTAELRVATTLLSSLAADAAAAGDEDEAIHALRNCEYLLSLVETHELEIDLGSVRCLVLAQLAMGKMDGAEELARRFSHSDRAAPSAILMAPIIEMSPSTKAIALFDELEVMPSGIKTTDGDETLEDGVILAERVVAFHGVLQACENDGNGHAALNLYEQLLLEGITPSHSILGLVFGSFARTSPVPMWREAYALFTEILGTEHLQEPASDIVLKVLLACTGSSDDDDDISENGMFEAAHATLRAAREFAGFRPTTTLLRTALMACVDSRTPTRTERRVAEMKRRIGVAYDIIGMYKAFKLPLESYDVQIIFGVARCLNADGIGVDMIMRLLDTVVPENLILDRSTFNFAVSACVQAGRWREARSLLHRMTIAAAESHVSNAPLPDASFYHAVIAAHTNAQKKAECSGDDDGLECVSSMHDVVAEMRFAGFELDATSVQEHDYDIARDCLQ